MPTRNVVLTEYQVKLIETLVITPVRYLPTRLRAPHASFRAPVQFDAESADRLQDDIRTSLLPISNPISTPAGLPWRGNH